MGPEGIAPSALAHFDPADLLDALTTGIVMLDAQLCPTYANVAAQDLLAFSLKKARGRPFADFLHDANGLSRILRRALETGEGIADRELAVRPVGAPRELRTLDVTITPLTGLTGTHLLLELADTTQRQRITRDYDPCLPNAMLDRHQLSQALLNVARNALQSQGNLGRIVLRTRARSNVSIGSALHRLVASVQVEDAGPGVPPHLRSSIFYPLVTGRANGTGLGLAVAQDLVTRNGGIIEFESELGRTVFTLLLPLGEEP